MQELLRHSTIRVTLDTYTQVVTTEKRNAQGAVVTIFFREKRRKRKFCLDRVYFLYLIVCLFLPTRKWSSSGKFLGKNGGDDETRTRDLCRDSGWSPAGPHRIKRLRVRLSATVGFIGQRRLVLVQRFVQPSSPLRACAKT
jgi:hypothetical protein